ncbi:hypothetical protein EDD18DRAFT_657024 [Armillaria luteobubalina]|uniref:Defect at low temperature protein 1 n=1 Tax=Armillaria luteobubalina TaxID=153913 RepID=A0AA39UGZ7_9AGAR|nr:hypothetical protein EDD18DRAFT_657024 [Armillaria luteobubalina]
MFIFPWALLFLLFSPKFVLAAPTGGISNNASYNLSASLAVLLTFLVVLTVLVVLKHIYIKRRRIRNLHCDASASSLAIDSQKSSDSSILSSLRYMTSKDGLAAFLVGFLGSPFLETSTQAWRNRLSWKEGTQSSFMYSLHVQSRSYKGSRSRQTFNEKSSSTNEFGEKDAYIPDVSNSKQSSSLSSNGSLPPGFPILLPTAPQKARRVPSKHGHDRCLSLPNTTATRKTDCEGTTIHQKRHSSLKSSKSRRSDSSIVLSPGLRMVYTNNSLDYPLPLSSEDLPLFNFSARECKPDQSHVPPLPPLPPITPLLPSPVDFCNPDGSIGRSYISHPYALAPYTKKSILKQTPKDHAETIHDKIVSKAPIRSPSIARNSYTFIPPPPPFTEIPPIPLPLPLPPREPIPALPKVRPNTRSLSVRSRKSPPIGPSPLRIMTLPESVISDLLSLSTSQPDPPNTNEYQDHSSYTAKLNRRSYSSIGLGFPPVPRAGDCNADSAKRSSIDSTSSKHIGDDDGSNLLLGIIRELVEETSQWDTSLYMDDKFKSMIETAGNEGRGLEKCESVASPVEVDLGLLGLEVFRGQFGNGDENTDLGVGLAW